MKARFELSLEDADYRNRHLFIETTEDFCFRGSSGEGERYVYLCLHHSVSRSERDQSLTFVFHPHNAKNMPWLVIEAIAAFEKENVSGLQRPSDN